MVCVAGLGHPLHHVNCTHSSDTSLESKFLSASVINDHGLLVKKFVRDLDAFFVSRFQPLQQTGQLRYHAA